MSQCALIPGVTHDNPQPLRQEVEARGLQGCATSYLLGPEDYQLLLVEAPAVPEAELLEALQWRVKDLIAYDVAEAVIDYVTLPEDAYRGRSRMLYVAVMNRQVSEQAEALTRAVGLHLDILDIPELALLNLSDLLPAESTGSALLGLQAGTSHINLLAEGQLYLTRSLEAPAEVLSPDATDIESRASALVLDIQRSLDYYESQIGKPPCLKLLVCPLQPGETPLLSQFRYNLPVEVVQLDLGEWLTSAEPLTPLLQAQCLPAIAAALRPEGAA
ncbi:hypothetical protein [Motiliproteus sp. SC1-56]|uniref:hypothetical protein n=1 Tax=Motiliproteus sp. SC1-56 TaxID=2799565 RepID=UPI001A8D2BB1|nr:hypothetical protein [Motiliproteus sp. SC1-56]